MRNALAPQILAAGLAAPLLLIAPVQAQSPLGESARASGEVAGASVEVTARLAASGVTVTAGTLVGVTGTGAAIITADPDVLDDSWELAGRIAEAPFADLEPLAVDEDVIIADPAPSVPYQAQQPEQD